MREQRQELERSGERPRWRFWDAREARKGTRGVNKEGGGVRRGEDEYGGRESDLLVPRAQGERDK